MVDIKDKLLHYVLLLPVVQKGENVSVRTFISSSRAACIFVHASLQHVQNVESVRKNNGIVMTC